MTAEKNRQAAYASRNRQKSKLLGRPDGCAVADAYMTSIEGGGLEQLMRIYISKLAPDAGSRQIKEMIRTLVRVALFERGFNDEQVRDKMKSMQND
jgi:hypothetical protein